MQLTMDKSGPHDWHEHLPKQPELRLKAIEEILVSKGLIDSAAVDRIVELYQNVIGPRNGARVVARSWSDSGFRASLLEDATSAVANMGFGGRQGEHLIAVENSEQLHNLVVCTLCSCYPWPLLGIPPTWYKSDEYRGRAVREPRQVLEEFGVELDPDCRIRVWDSTAEIRYIVIPMRPLGTSGMSESQLAELVTRDSMIGTGLALAPSGEG